MPTAKSRVVARLYSLTYRIPHCAVDALRPSSIYRRRMPDLASNILVVSDLHFGEELLPGAGLERRRAVELGATAFREFLAHHAPRRRDGRPWRLVIAGDLF